MELWRYARQRLFQIGIIFFVILTILFILFRIAPGDPVSRMIGPEMTTEDAAHLISQLGLDRP
ncbi:MAG: ABC transporter permease, partial [Deltaproteobacteria bacterium]|nr:ABC transporter permease [Deltaproteobacteria bacterium]